MNILSKGRFLMGWAVVACLCGAVLAADAVSIAVAPDAPREAPSFKAGDTLVIATERASVLVGREVLATLPQGMPIVVVEVRDAWVGTYVSVNGQQKAGWIDTANFLPVNSPVKPGPASHIVAKPVASETVQAAAATAAPVRYGSLPADDYFSDYYYGYYTRHETDPNIHVWEPWRYRR